MKVGYYALMMASQEMGLEFKEGEQDSAKLSNFEYFTRVLYYSLELGADVVKKPFTLKEENMRLMLNDCFPEFMQVFQKFTSPEKDAKEDSPGGAELSKK